MSRNAMTCAFEKSTNDGGSSFVDSSSGDPTAADGETGRYVFAITQKGHDGLKSLVSWSSLAECGCAGECSWINLASWSILSVLLRSLREISAID